MGGQAAKQNLWDKWLFVMKKTNSAFRHVRLSKSFTHEHV